MGRNAKRKKNKKFQLPTLSIPPVGTHKYFSKGNFANGAAFEVDIVESARTQRFLVCLDPNFRHRLSACHCDSLGHFGTCYVWRE